MARRKAPSTFRSAGAAAPFLGREGRARARVEVMLDGAGAAAAAETVAVVLAAILGEGWWMIVGGLLGGLGVWDGVLDGLLRRRCRWCLDVSTRNGCEGRVRERWTYLKLELGSGLEDC